MHLTQKICRIPLCLHVFIHVLLSLNKKQFYNYYKTRKRKRNQQIKEVNTE